MRFENRSTEKRAYLSRCAVGARYRMSCVHVRALGAIDALRKTTIVDAVPPFFAWGATR